MKAVLSLLLSLSLVTATCTVPNSSENLQNTENKSADTDRKSGVNLLPYVAGAVALAGVAGAVFFREALCQEVTSDFSGTKGAFISAGNATNEAARKAYERTIAFFTTTNSEKVAVQPAVDEPVTGATGHVHHHGCACGHNHGSHEHSHMHDDAVSVDESVDSVASTMSARALRAVRRAQAREEATVQARVLSEIVEESAE